MFDKLVNEENSEQIDSLIPEVTHMLEGKEQEYIEYWKKVQKMENNLIRKYNEEISNNNIKVNTLMNNNTISINSNPPIDLTKYILSKEYESSLFEMRPILVPRTKPTAQSLLIVFNNLAVQYEQLGHKKIALEY